MGAQAMRFEGIQFHNVEILVPAGDGYRLGRVPEYVRVHMAQGEQSTVSYHSTGVELRFKPVSDEVTLILRAQPAAEASVVAIYFGAIQGGWEHSTRIIGTEPTRITIRKPTNMDELWAQTRTHQWAYSPEVVRVLLPYNEIYYLGVEGEVVPPEQGELPQRTYLAYGSSITHGSLGLLQPLSYPCLIGRRLNCDYINLGFAGSALLEPELARHIVSRQDWQFASVEMGINMIKHFSCEEFEARVQAFVDILCEDTRPIFATSLFTCLGADQDKAARFREIVQKHAQGRLIFIDGQVLLDDTAYLSQDMVHPALEGQLRIAENWSKIMEQHLRREAL